MQLRPGRRRRHELAGGAIGAGVHAETWPSAAPHWTIARMADFKLLGPGEVVCAHCNGEEFDFLERYVPVVSDDPNASDTWTQVAFVRCVACKKAAGVIDASLRSSVEKVAETVRFIFLGHAAKSPVPIG